jgi:glyoxylase-like metal-dependent hydrolase (beta-lactamase superfamily II)
LKEAETMSIKIIPFVLGPLTNNTYLLVDEASRDAIVIDPSFGINTVIDEIDQHQWKLSRILLTHAHFDHLAGVPALAQAIHPAPPVELHAGDAPLYAAQGNAELFGFHIDPLPPVSHELKHQGVIKFGNANIEIRHAPGHTAGHVIFYISKLSTLFSGDVIFYQGIGRTDLPGGDYQRLADSIRTQVFSLPLETVILSGHGPQTSVGSEMNANPYL